MLAQQPKGLPTREPRFRIFLFSALLRSSRSLGHRGMFPGQLSAGLVILGPLAVAVSAEYFATSHVVVSVTATVGISFDWRLLLLDHSAPPARCSHVRLCADCLVSLFSSSRRCRGAAK